MNRKAKLRVLVEGRIFIGIVQLLILASAIVYVIESDRRHLAVDPYRTHFIVLEVMFLVLFSIEYLLRVYIRRGNGILFSVSTAS